MINPSLNDPSLLENILYNDIWPEYFFVNEYPVLGVFWNILLLLIPFVLASILIRYWRKNKFQKVYQKTVALFIGFLWLLFIPNTAYIIMDVRHLLDYCEDANFYRICVNNTWMIMFFYVYASVGWIGFTILLSQMRSFIDEVWGKVVSKFFVILVIPIISVGILIGLLDRWNSWDFFVHPLGVINSLIEHAYYFVYFRNWLVFTISLYILYFAGNYLFKEKFSKFK